MAFCTNCGSQVAEGVKFCTSCGAPQPGGETAQQEQPQQAPQPAQQPQAQQSAQSQQPYGQQHYQQPAYGQPPYQPQYQPPYMEEPISTGSYIGIFLLLMIPLVNLVCLIIWACGGCNKKNKTNLSRAMLVWMLIGAIIGGIIVLAGGMLFGDSLNELRELGNELNNLSGSN